MREELRILGLDRPQWRALIGLAKAESVVIRKHREAYDGLVARGYAKIVGPGEYAITRSGRKMIFAPISTDDALVAMTW